MADRFQALYLGSIFKNKENPPCCPLVIFQDSDSVSFTGLGTHGNPFIAIATSSGGSPAGANNDIQFNEGGIFAADSGAFTYDPSTGTFFTPSFNASATSGLVWGDGTGNVFSAGPIGLQYANIDGSELNLIGGILEIVAQVGIGISPSGPSANLQIKAGSVTSGTAPLKFNAGPVLTTPEAGAIEFDGTHFFGTSGVTRTQFDNYLIGSGLTLATNTVNLGGTLTTAVTQLLTGGNLFRIRDSTSDVGHNLQHIWQGAAYVLNGDSTNNFPSKIEIQDTNSTVIGLRLLNNTNNAGFNMLSMQMFNGVTANPSINFLNNGNVIIANTISPTDDGTSIQIKGALSTDNNIGIGVSGASITAHLHISAGSITAGTAPIKLISGPVMTTPETGAFEFDGTNLFFTIGGVRKTFTLL